MKQPTARPATPPPDTRLATVRQAAEILSTSVDYVYDRIADGTIPTTQLGTGKRSMRRVQIHALEAFIAERSTGGTK